MIHPDYRILVGMSLQGYDIPMVTKPIRFGGSPFRTETGEEGFFFDAQPEALALLRWRERAFTESEEILAQKWRDAIRRLDPERTLKELRGLLGRLEELKSCFDLVRRAEEMLCASNQTAMLYWLMDELQLDGKIQKEVIQRRAENLSLKMREFAPYAFYVCKAMIAYHLGLASGIITTRRTNRIDLEYLFYLPFCKVFTTNDQFQEGLGKALLSEEQEFVPGLTLKEDLHRIASWWNQLGPKEREDNAFDFGDFPPDLEGSVTAELWKRYMRPRTPGSGNRLIRMSAEEKKQLWDDLAPIRRALGEVTKAE